MNGRLYVVATPIGNLGDLSPRALQTLEQCNRVAAEDTRRSRRLLQAHDLNRPLVALHDHNEKAVAGQLVARMKAGDSIALVSDAGTPLVSDPGYRLVSLAAAEGIEVIAVPGPSAVTAALSISGIPTDRFSFEGFLPSRSVARNKKLLEMKHETRTQVFFESGQRIVSCLEDMLSVMGEERQVAVCREMTKQFETVIRGSLQQVGDIIRSDPMQQKGEFAIVLAAAQQDADQALRAACELAEQLQQHVSPSQAARIAASIHGVQRREVYRQLEQDPAQS